MSYCCVYVFSIWTLTIYRTRISHATAKSSEVITQTWRPAVRCFMFAPLAKKVRGKYINKNKTQPNTIFRFAETTFFRHASRSAIAATTRLYNRSNPVIVIYIKKKKTTTRIQSALLYIGTCNSGCRRSLCYIFARIICIYLLLYAFYMHLILYIGI